MPGSSVAATFQFLGYKIDNVALTSMPHVDLLSSTAISFPGYIWKIAIKVRPPQYFKVKNIYVGGLDCVVELVNETETVPPSSIVRLQVGIAGGFQMSGEILDKAVESQLVKIQIPHLLMSNLRAAVIGFLSFSGFPSFVFPLINVHKLAEEQLNNVEVELVEND